ncbi:aminopeptidase N [Rheinheimera marina]|uniref:Aminopeptidase N n=1 Tax=Rheinheimera marina TaxID=1774958 RepID=A0ABV9JJG7_9GAMM
MTQNTLRQAKRLADYQAPDFTITDVELWFELEPATTLLTARYQLKSQRKGATELVLDGQQLELLSVKLNGQQLTPAQYQVTDDHLRIDQMPAQAELELQVRLNPAANTALEGLYLSDSAFCTQCEAEGFRRICYYLDRPDVMARFTTHIIANQQRYPALLSNGNKVAEQQLPDGRVQVSWVDPFPKPCYLFALVAGDFDCLTGQYVTQSGRTVSLEFYVDKGNAARAEFALEALKRAMCWDEQTYGLEYDLDSYMVVAVDFFNMGAMENKGLNVFNSKYVLADQQSATDTDLYNIESIIGHEYFHNWTGNRVTCRDWFQLSLKEGLTVFRDQQFSADMASATLSRIDAVKTIRTHQFAEDAGPMAHPIRPAQVLEMNNFYTVTVYDKGAEVIRMLHTLLGAAGFRQGMDLYFARHDGQAVTCDDFVSAMQDANGRDLSLFRRWYSQSGTPELTVQSSFDAEQQQFKLVFSQHTAATADQQDKRNLLLPVRIELLAKNEKQQHLLVVSEEQQSFSFAVAEPPVAVILADFSAPVRLHYPQSVSQLLTVVQHASDGVARWDAMQQLWSDLVRQAVRSSEPLQVPAEVVALYRALLATPEGDLAFLAELLTPPSFDLLAEQYQPVPVDALLQALQQIRRQLADELAADWLNCYQQLIPAPYAYRQEQVAARALRALCLDYLAQSGQQAELLLQAYQSADNLTDQLAVLKACRNATHPLFETLTAQFEQRWREDVLVLDKWFALKASLPTKDTVYLLPHLTQHPQFSWQNPNRVRAVYMAFAQQNPTIFHAADGKGYQVLQQVVLKLDPINPQLAARLVTPLLSWRRFETHRAAQLKAVLSQMLAQQGLSNDLYEKLSKSLSD